MKVWAEDFKNAMSNCYSINKSSVKITIDKALDYMLFESENCGVSTKISIKLDSRYDNEEDFFLVMEGIRPIRTFKTKNGALDVSVDTISKKLNLKSYDVNLSFEYAK